MVINGGQVRASSQFGAGIGGGDGNPGGITTINGGTVSGTSNAGAGIGGGDNGDGGTITIDGGTVTAASVLGAGIGGGSAGAGGTVTIGAGADVTASGFSAIGPGQGAVPFGVLSVAGTLRIPTGVLSMSNLTFGPEITVTSTGKITGLDASPTVGAQIQGLASTGTIDNGGTITLASSLLSGILMFDHNYRFTFDSQGGSAESPVTVYARRSLMARVRCQLPPSAATSLTAGIRSSMVLAPTSNPPPRCLAPPPMATPWRAPCMPSGRPERRI